MSRAYFLLFLFPFTGILSPSVGQTEMSGGHGGKETLSHLEGVAIWVITKKIRPTERDQEIARRLKKEVVEPMLKRAGIKIYSMREPPVESSPTLKIEFMHEPPAYSVGPMEVMQDVLTHGGVELTAVTYRRRSAVGGRSRTPYAGLSGGISEMLRAFIEDWNAVH